MKKILMSMRVTEASNYKEKRNSIAFEYIEFFENLGFFIQLIPNNTKYLNEYFDNNVKALVLTGGNDVSAKLYKSNEILPDVYEQRDNTEKLLIELALKKNIFVLGICRGFHFINVFYGGKISHNIKHHVNKKHTLDSNITILNGKSTNSYHNQGIYLDDLAKDLDILAKSNDGLIEAFKHKTDKIFAIQWHPERQNETYDKKLIKYFFEGIL